jgi:hypothetical protein
VFQYCCTTPNPGGTGNLTNNPLFVNFATGDCHLQAGSPCIDKGNNAYMASGYDLDGTPRPLDGDAIGTATVDIGCYEYLNSAADSNGDGIPDGWAIAHGLNPTTPGDATNNPDGDAFNNWQEYIADTNPTNPASYFHITAISNLPPWAVYFDSSSNRLYTLYSRTNLTAGAWLAVPGQSNIVGTGGRMSLRDTNAAAARCYRVQVRLP